MKTIQRIVAQIPVLSASDQGGPFAS